MGNWTYYPTQLSTSVKDQVRFLIGDTLASDPQLQDEEINYAITQRASALGAAADCCRAIANKFSRSVDQAAGMAKASFSQMAKAYALRSIQLEVQASSNGSGMPYAGGISIFDKVTQMLDEDRVEPAFQIGMDQNLIPVPPADQESASADPNSPLSGQ